MKNKYSIFKIFKNDFEFVYKFFKDTKDLIFMIKIKKYFVKDINRLHNNKCYVHRSSKTDESEFFILRGHENEPFEPKINQYPDGTICFSTKWNWSTPYGNGRRLLSLIGDERRKKISSRGYKEALKYSCFAFYHKLVDLWIVLPSWAIYEMCYKGSKIVAAVYNYPLPGSPNVDDETLRDCERFLKSEGDWEFNMDFNKECGVINHYYDLYFDSETNRYKCDAKYYNKSNDNNCERTESCTDYDSWCFTNLLDFFNDDNVPYQVKECLIDDAFNWCEANPVEDDEDEE